MPFPASQGAAILELALIIPLILLLILGTVEISRVMRASQIANQLSEEASNSIYRECSDFLEPAGETSSDTLNRTSQCVQDTYNKEFAPLIAQLARPGAIRIVLSIYREVAGPIVQRFALINDGAAPTSTKFSASGNTIATTLTNVGGGGTVVIDAAFMAAHQRVAIAEVFIQVDPLLNIIPILNTAVIGGKYYAASVL